MSNGCEIIKCKYWDGKMCNGDFDTCVHQINTAPNPLHAQFTDLQSRLTAAEKRVGELEGECTDSDKMLGDKLARIKELELDKRNLEEIETDNSTTIGFLERGVSIWKGEAEETKTKLTTAVEALEKLNETPELDDRGYDSSYNSGFNRCVEHCVDIATEALTSIKEK